MLPSDPPPAAPLPWYDRALWIDEATGYDMRVGLPVKVIGGRFNGLKGDIALVGDEVALITVLYDNKPVEIVESLSFTQPLAAWRAGRGDAELALRGEAAPDA